MSWSIPLRGTTGLPTHGGGPGSSQLSDANSNVRGPPWTLADIPLRRFNQQIWTMRDVPGHSGNTPKVPG